MARTVVPVLLDLPWQIQDQVFLDRDKSIRGYVTAITLREKDVLYEVSWLHNGTAHAAWFPDWRLALADGNE